MFEEKLTLEFEKWISIDSEIIGCRVDILYGK